MFKKILLSLVAVFCSFIFLSVGNNASANSGYCKSVYYAANGYSCRYRNGKWDYKVTKSPFEAVTGVMANGWVSSLAGGYYHPNYRG